MQRLSSRADDPQELLASSSISNQASIWRRGDSSMKRRQGVDDIDTSARRRRLSRRRR